MKNIFILLTLVVSLGAWSQDTIFLRAESKMEVISSVFGFEDVTVVTVKLFENEEKKPVSIVLEFNEIDENGDAFQVVQELDVNAFAKDPESEVITASLPQMPEPVDQISRVMGDRFSMTLIDYSVSDIDGEKEFVWEAIVNRGYGWCGTMDDRMELVGNPVRDGNPLLRN